VIHAVIWFVVSLMLATAAALFIDEYLPHEEHLP
jgi:hypothetical protein